MSDTEKQGVDIVVLNYNNIGLIEKCVQSIRAHSQGHYNLIVVDQGSTDGSREWLKNKVDHLILNKENTGAWEGRNQGVREARYDLIVFCDSDIEIKDSHWLDKLWCCAVGNVGMVEARVKLWDNSYRFAGFACCMIRRVVFREIGLFDSKFLIGGDLDFWARYMWNGKFGVDYAEDTDIYHSCGGTLHWGALKEQEVFLDKKFRKDMMEYKYNPVFLKNTVVEMNRMRYRFEKERGLVK